jgi:hypothetical protein
MGLMSEGGEYGNALSATKAKGIHSIVHFLLQKGATHNIPDDGWILTKIIIIMVFLYSLSLFFFFFFFFCDWLSIYIYATHEF